MLPVQPQPPSQPLRVPGASRVPPPPRTPSAAARRLIFRYQGTQLVFLLVGTIFTAIGCILSTVSCWGLPVDLALAFTGKEAQATVLSTELNRNVRINHQHPTRIRFRYQVDGKSFDGESSTLDADLLRAAESGAGIPIEVLPSQPSFARVKGTTYSSFGYAVCFVLIFPLLGGALLFVAVRSNRREIRAFTQGLCVPGRILSKGPDLSTRINGRHPFKVDWEFSVQGTRYKGSLSFLDDQAAGAFDELEEVPVLYDAAAPDVNTIFVD